MVDIIQPIKELNDKEHAGYYHARSRSRAARELIKGLFRSHDFGVNTAAITTSDVFPDRDRPITIVTAIEITGADPVGVIFEFGDSTTGFKLALSQDTIFAAVGDAVGDDGIDGNAVLPMFDTIGAVIDLALSVNPGNGAVRLWVQGVIEVRVQSVALMANGWSSSAGGAVGAAENGTSTQRGQAVNGAPVDFALVDPCRAFIGQLPRFFD